MRPLFCVLEQNGISRVWMLNETRSETAELRLKKLAVKGNNIADVRFSSLGRVLECNTFLEFLDLRKNGSVSERGIRALLQ